MSNEQNSKEEVFTFPDTIVTAANEVEEGLKKMCTDCSQPGTPVFMDFEDGTAAEIYQDEAEDNTFTRKWAICRECGKIIAV